ncbi:hypothetical protein acdb102_22270 [Acidothermaceae bacterium B102]|nr:hypothetical protein acdb102_22270 [Acidothermaceae bacterium B102]
MPRPAAEPDRRPSGTPRRLPAGFAVIDVETTGLSAATHRILELAIIRTDTAGGVVDEWTTRFNPGGSVGATHIHGITAADVRDAPEFADLIPQITSWLVGGAIVAHNARFDLAFLRAEYARAGWSLPHLPALCTLEASDTYLPGLARRRLVDCCHAAGVPLTEAHSALGDSRATAGLLTCYLTGPSGIPIRREHLALVDAAAAVVWPSAPGPLPVVPKQAAQPFRRYTSAPARAAAPPLVDLLEGFHLADALDEGAPLGSLPYLELLAQAVEDGEISSDEQTALSELAGLYDLAGSQVTAAHRGFLLALAHLASDDGRITHAERDELRATASLLHLPDSLVADVLDEAETARHERLSSGLIPLPPDWSLGQPLQVGQKVAFTGCDDTTRDQLERQAERLGVRVMNTVSRRTALLVTDGTVDGVKAADAAAAGTRTVTPREFAVLLAHLQPAERIAARPPAGAPRAARDGAPKVVQPREVTGFATAGDAPADVRRWARANGLEVGARGRVPTQVFAAYATALAAANQDIQNG